jgi:2-polyprenyl-3-methyl-5-hydroxy-6-metoxy-1,4-benzoquinol methylase
LVRRFLSEKVQINGSRVLDLGCGEGKNASAFAQAGAVVTAVDCSIEALRHASRFQHENIEWVNADCRTFLGTAGQYDVVVMYGLLHCLGSKHEIERIVRRALEITSPGGIHILAAFNDGPHDLSAHPGFAPILAPHSFYLALYGDQDVQFATSKILQETHPHNEIPHFHSLTRIIAKKRS